METEKVNYGNKNVIKNYIKDEIIENNRRLNLAINGEWGIGKSYMIEQINEEMMDGKALIINTWKLSDLKTLENMLQYEFLSNKDKYNNEIIKENVAKSFKKNCENLLNNYADKNAKLGLMRDVAKIVKKSTDTDMEEDADFDLLLELKQYGVDYIFIDELDRCLPETAIQIFREIIFLNEEKNENYPLFITSTNLSAFSASLKHIYGETYQTEAYFDKTFDVILDVVADLYSKYDYLEERLPDTGFGINYRHEITYVKREQNINTILNKMTFRKLENLVVDMKNYGVTNIFGEANFFQSIDLKICTFILDFFALKYINFIDYSLLFDAHIRQDEWEKILKRNMIDADNISYNDFIEIIKGMQKYGIVNL